MAKSAADGTSGFTPVRKFLENPLFKPDYDSAMNAAVGDNGGPYNFGTYGQGFFEAGFASIEAARRYTAPVDVLIYPIVYSFRHGIELYTKYFLVELKAHGATEEDFRVGHGLEGNWASFKKVAAASGFEEFTPEQISAAGKAIDYFCEIDPAGQFFRYPENLKKERSLLDVALINVNVLGKGMREVFEIFEDWHRHLYERRGMMGDDGDE